MMAIEAECMVKSYKNVKAVHGVSFQVQKGEIFGLLGPNGAGKTTTIECLTGLTGCDGGSVRVLGLNPMKSRRELNRRIGVQMQETSWQDKVRVDEICRLFSSLYENPSPWEDLLRKFDLQEKKHAYVASLSGGQRQKLSILLALLPKPEIVFLDELTTGLDPEARRAMWGHIRSLKDGGRTVFMTTHYMEEAEALCDTVCILKSGSVAALDPVPKVVRDAGLPEKITFESAKSLRDALKTTFPMSSVRQEHTAYVVTSREDNFSGRLIAWLETGSIPYRNLSIHQPALEDAYLKITGTEKESVQ